MPFKKKVILVVSMIFGVIVLALASSYALFNINVTKNSNFKLAIGTLELSITDTTTEDKFIMESTVPTKDKIALEQDGYTFTITNTGTIDSFYTVYLDDILLTDAGDRLDNSYVKMNLVDDKTGINISRRLSDYDSVDRILTTGYLKTKESVTYTLRMWVDYNAGNEAQNKYFATQIRVVGQQKNAIAYTENILNGADPVLTDNLVAVMIADDGTVTKAATNSQWYDYETKQWANAVVLKDTSVRYANNQIIPEDNIESYFVWIPKYSYQLWDLGNYDSLTTIDSTKPHAIPIRFGLTNTSDAVEGECTTPGVAGESGNCKVGDYMTHPAFLAFNTNGLWVGKFETGYDGATSKLNAEVDSSDSNKVIIKPNVYSWRNLTLGNMFKASYDYLRKDESHMMKNTEWGAVAYLSHSIYGVCTGNSCNEIRINNNSAYITGYASLIAQTNSDVTEETSLGLDGTNTVNYLNTNGNVASTTLNYTGLYDMSGGAWEYVMGYTVGASTIGGSSGIITLYSDFLTDSKWLKYYDKYSSTTNTTYNDRILGDAIGEVGPFVSVSNIVSSWYEDRARFIHSSNPWFFRSGYWENGSDAGSFAFSNTAGDINNAVSFRIVLAPSK